MDFPQFGGVSFAKEIGKPGTEFLPHRPPFIFVDKLVACDEKGALGEVVFGPEHYFFKGHFPDYPIVPGVILVETMAQTAGAGLVADGIFGDTVPIFLFAGIESAKFKQPVRPTDKFTSVIINEGIRHGMGFFNVKGYVQKLDENGVYGEPKVAVIATIKCMLPPTKKDA